MGQPIPTVVIGGGIMGATIFYELARRSQPVLLFEARSYAYESTGKSAGLVRMHYTNPDVVRVALHSREMLASLPQVLGCKPVYHPLGWLFLVDSDAAETAASHRVMQVREGVDVVEVPVAELEELVPDISTDGVAYALHEKRSGFADPVATTLAYIRAGERLGGFAHQNAPVSTIEAHDDGRGKRVVGVVVRGERIQCERVVLAAGAWSTRLASALGLDIPFRITREQDAVFYAPHHRINLAISDQAGRIYLRPYSEGGDGLLLAGRGFPKEYEAVDPDDYDQNLDRDFERDVRLRLAVRFPKLRLDATVDSRVGLYAVTPDWHPILGPVDDVGGLYLATGGSGHSFKLGPAIGDMVVRSMMGETVEYADVNRFQLSRFAKGFEFASAYGGNRA